MFYTNTRGGMKRMRSKYMIYKLAMLFVVLIGTIQSTSAQGVIQSRIISNYDGLEHGNLYQLQNGQIWKQTEFYIYIHIAVNPRVLIYQDGIVVKMKVEGIDHAVIVERLK